MTAGGHLTTVTGDQMRAVDRIMTDELGIGLIQMMENAGRNLAHLARVRFLDGDPRGRRVVVLAGTGGNGGGALVAARRLHCWGADVRVLVTAADAAFSPVPRQQLGIVRRLGVPVSRTAIAAPDPLDLILDGLIGYSLRGAPAGAAADLIRWSNEQAVDVLSLDVPSGLDVTTGVIHVPAVLATATMTLAYPKQGLRTAAAGEYVGELYLADISVPPAVMAGVTPGSPPEPIFARDEIIRLG